MKERAQVKVETSDEGRVVTITIIGRKRLTAGDVISVLESFAKKLLIAGVRLVGKSPPPSARH